MGSAVSKWCSNNMNILVNIFPNRRKSNPESLWIESTEEHELIDHCGIHLYVDVLSMYVHTGMSQLRASQNMDFPRLWVTGVPPALSDGRSHAFQGRSEDKGSQMFSPSSLHACPFLCHSLQHGRSYWKIREGSWCAPSSPDVLPASGARALPVILSVSVCPCSITVSPGIMTKWRSTCLFGSCAIICLFLWSFSSPA